MIEFSDDIVLALNSHVAAWQEIQDGLPQDVAEQIIPTTMSLKVGSKAIMFALLQENVSGIEQVHIGTVNDRFIASAVLTEPYHGLPILKILERRPTSRDPLGLDSVDYLYPDIDEMLEVLKAAGLPATKESNDVHSWLSLRFGEHDRFEAKFVDHLLTDVAITELQMADDRITESLR